MFTGLFELESHLKALRNNTKQFNAELQRLLRADGVDTETFHEVKAATVAYLQDFLGNLDQRAFTIRASLERIDQHGVRGRMSQAPWDAALAPAMTERGLAVFEEQVTDQLLIDLAHAH